MPRQARLDAPGILHHVLVRGLERRPIFRDGVDRRDFCTRLGGLDGCLWVTINGHEAGNGGYSQGLA
ncbi:MAG: hypothetical protein V3U14_03075 [candidate division NC10 bacterium]